jgi:hypothetical protein
VAPFGESDWVLSLRAAGQARLTSGRRIREVAPRELDQIPEDPVQAAGANIVFEVVPLESMIGASSP